MSAPPVVMGGRIHRIGRKPVRAVLLDLRMGTRGRFIFWPFVEIM